MPTSRQLAPPHRITKHKCHLCVRSPVLPANDKATTLNFTPTNHHIKLLSPIKDHTLHPHPRDRLCDNTRLHTHKLAPRNFNTVSQSWTKCWCGLQRVVGRQGLSSSSFGRTPYTLDDLSEAIGRPQQKPSVRCNTQNVPGPNTITTLSFIRYLHRNDTLRASPRKRLPHSCSDNNQPQDSWSAPHAKRSRAPRVE